MIWVIGAAGMLGSDLVDVLEQAGWPVLATDRECDIRSLSALQAVGQGRDISWIINCCAYTAVDQAEAEESECVYALNADGAANVAEVARMTGARLIHLSTDYVFDGKARQPYTESMPVSPVGVYAASKAEGEKRVCERLPEAFILRTAWLYGLHGANFVHTMLRLMRERETLSVVDDQHGSPTWTQTVCRVIAELIRQNVAGGGIYHVTDRGVASWFDFACEIQKQAIRKGVLNRQCAIEPIATKDYPAPAKRPSYSVLACEKVERLLGMTLSPWQHSLESFMTRYVQDRL